MEKFYKLSEISKICGLSKPTLIKYIKEHRLTANFVGNKYLVAESDLRQFLTREQMTATI